MVLGERGVGLERGIKAGVREERGTKWPGKAYARREGRADSMVANGLKRSETARTGRLLMTAVWMQGALKGMDFLGRFPPSHNALYSDGTFCGANTQMCSLDLLLNRRMLVKMHATAAGRPRPGFLLLSSTSRVMAAISLLRH